jgi:hypothetical protein
MDLQGKQTLLFKVFELGLLYNKVVVRTPHIHNAVMHNYSKTKEKGLLVIEQPLENSAFLDACTA